VIEFSPPGGYPEVLEAVKVHGYDMARRLGALPSPEDVAADWYDGVYLPGVAARGPAGDVLLQDRRRSLPLDLPAGGAPCA
jgi:hypothetical protein